MPPARRLALLRSQVIAEPTRQGATLSRAARGLPVSSYSQRLGWRLGEHHGGTRFEPLRTSSAACRRRSASSTVRSPPRRAGACALIWREPAIPVAAESRERLWRLAETAAEPSAWAAAAPRGRSIEDAVETRARDLCDGAGGGARGGRGGSGAPPAVPFHAHRTRENFLHTSLTWRTPAPPAGLRARRAASVCTGLPISPGAHRAQRTHAAVNFMSGCAQIVRARRSRGRRVKRVSLSTSLYRPRSPGCWRRARSEASRTFSYVETLMRGDELDKYLRQQALARDGA